MLTIRIKVPQPSSMLGANLLGLLGLVLVVAAVGGLTHNWWWSALVGGVFAVGLSVNALSHAAAEAAPAALPAPQPATSGPVSLASAA